VVVSPVLEPVKEPVVVIVPSVVEPVKEPVVIVPPVVEPVKEPVVVVAPVVKPIIVITPVLEPVKEPIVVIPPVVEPVVVMSPVVKEPIVIVTPVVEPVKEPVVVIPPITIPINCEPSILNPLNNMDSINIDPKPIPINTFKKPSVKITKNCDSSSYSINVKGCSFIKEESYFLSLTRLNTNELEVTIKADTNRIFQIACLDSMMKSDSINLSKFTKPQIHILKNFDKVICPNTPIQLSSICTENIDFIHWEKDGHSYSKDEKIISFLENGIYQAVYQNKECLYRSEAIIIDRLPTISRPVVRIPKNKICLQESMQIIPLEDSKYYEWNDLSTSKSMLFSKELQGNYPIKLRISNNGICWSDWSETKNINVVNPPKKPQITSSTFEVAANDSVQIHIKEAASKYEWTNGKTNQTIYSNQDIKLQYRIQNLDGCWSIFSDPIVVKQTRNNKPLSALEPKSIITELPERNNQHFIPYPNPCDGNVLFLDFLKKAIRPEVNMYDLKGELVYQMKYPGEYEHLKIENLNLKSGIYVLKIISEDWIEIKRLIVIK
jgi:hypothetical protein